MLQPNLYRYRYHCHQQQYYAPSNPFGDPFSDLVAMAAPQRQLKNFVKQPILT
jgi:hypothetical protein